jgi:putative membrane protein
MSNPVAAEPSGVAYGQDTGWQPARVRLRPVRLLGAWVVAAASVYVAAAIVPGFTLEQLGSAFVVAAAIAIFNAVLPPLVAALPLPGMLVLGFLLVLAVDALALVLADDLLPRFGEVDSFGTALLAALVMAAASIVLQVLLGTNDVDENRRRVV